MAASLRRRQPSSARFSAWMARWRESSRPSGSRGFSLAPLQRVEIGEVLVEQLQRALARRRRAVARHHRLGPLHQRRQPRQRGAVLVHRPALVEHRDLHVGEVVAAHQQAKPGSEARPSRRACGPRPGAAPARARPGPGGRAPAATASGPAPAAAAGARSARRRRRAARAGPRRAARGSAASCPRPGPSTGRGTPAGASRWSQSPWVASSALRLEARLRQHRGQQLQLVREVGRVHQHRLVARPDGGGGGLPQQAGDHDRVLVDRDRAHRSALARPRSAACPPHGRT